MAIKNRLGRGLDALIPIDMDEFISDSLPQTLKAAANEILEIDTTKISANPHQPRKDFPKDELSELATSIKTHGVIQPLIVIQKEPGKYQLVAGERRLRASKLAGLRTVPVIVRTYNEQEQLELAIIENIQRSDLKPLEVAIAYIKLIEQFNMTHSQIVQRVGRGSSTVSNAIRLVNLPYAAKLSLQNEQITEGHARAILSLSDQSQQVQLLEVIITSKLTVREAEEAARRFKSGNVDEKPAKAKQIRTEYASLTTSLGKHLGAKVNVHKTAKGGRLIIEYYSEEELHRIVGQIQGQE